MDTGPGGGLSAREAARRPAHDGTNELAAAERRSPLAIARDSALAVGVLQGVLVLGTALATYG